MSVSLMDGKRFIVADAGTKKHWPAGAKGDAVTSAY
jgi:hypothetical protein